MYLSQMFVEATLLQETLDELTVYVEKRCALPLGPRPPHLQGVQRRNVPCVDQYRAPQWPHKIQGLPQ